MRTTRTLQKPLTALLAFSAMLCCTGIASATTIDWTDWQTSGTVAGYPDSFVGIGTITTPTSTVNVTYTDLNGISFYQTGGASDTDYWQNAGGGRHPATSPYTSAEVDNIPTGTDIIALQYAGSQTLTFSQTIANPVFSFVSLNGNGYAFFDQDFDILSQTGDGQSGNDCGYWGCGNVKKQIIDLGGGNFKYELIQTYGEPHGTIQFKGAFNSVTWESQSNENWNGFTVGVQGTAAEVFGPEPSTMWLGAGVLAMIMVIARKRQQQIRADQA